MGLLCSSATTNSAVGLVLWRTQSATFNPPASVKRLALALKSEARLTSSRPERHRTTSIATAAAAVAGRCLSMLARTPPTTALPSSDQEVKNFVLSHTHGCRTMKFGTRNQSHIGAHHFGNAVGN